MKTFILEWNPAISSYLESDFRMDIGFLEFGDFNWSVWEHDKARSGDNFYLVRCGAPPTGIVMKGFFTSNPYRGQDWSGRGREVYYMNLRPTFMVSPDHPKGILSTGLLEKAMPDFEWNGGHSGRELPGTYRKILDELWNDYESRFQVRDFDGVLADRSGRPEAGIDEAIALASEALFDRKDKDGKPAILNALASGLAGTTERDKICGFLSPIIQETAWTAGEIRDKGFPEEIIDSLVSQIPSNA